MKYKASIKKCCSEFINIEKRNRALQRYTDILEQGKSTAGRSSTNTLENEFETENEFEQLRSQSINYHKNLCIICRKTSGNTQKVKTLETGKLMHLVANKIKNKDFFFLRLNSLPNPEDGVANDVRYHFSGWARF